MEGYKPERRKMGRPKKEMSSGYHRQFANECIRCAQKLLMIEWSSERLPRELSSHRDMLLIDDE
jgi:hypothetical protein